MSKLILIADDDDNDVTELRRILKEAGVKNRTITVDDGAKVIEYLKGKGKFANREKYPIPSILFLDLKMTRISGFEVMDWIRGTKFKDMLIVVLSGNGELDNVRQSYRLGARSFLIKPCNVADVLNLAKAYSRYWETPNLPKKVAGGRGTKELRTPLSL